MLKDQINAVLEGEGSTEEKEAAILELFEKAVDDMLAKAVAAGMGAFKAKAIAAADGMKAETVGNSPWLTIDKVKAMLAELE